MKKIIATIAATTTITVGCATPTPRPDTNPGPEPTREQAERAALDYLARNLKDPDSLKQFVIVYGPRIQAWNRGWANGGGQDSAWTVCYEYNAKNSYGAYAGLSRSVIGLKVWPDGVVSTRSLDWVACW